jgi:cell wall-associated NlpC family hydrolase/uncharacterized protein YukE
MTASAPLVDLFAEPIRTRLDRLSDRADLVDRTQTELASAATTTAEQCRRLTTKGAAVTEHWHGKAADTFARRATTAQRTLTTTAEALAAVDVLVRGALAAVRTGHATIRSLLEDYTGKGDQVFSAALKMLDAGHPTALIDAVGYLSTLSKQYTAEADTACHTARQALETAARDLIALDRLLPESKPGKPAHGTRPAKETAAEHTTARHPAHPKHDDGGGTTAPSAATTVHIGHGLGSVAAPNARAATAVRAALSQLGVPYVYGGENPGHAFDCSGLTSWAYRKAGIILPHYASSQRIGGTVSEKDLRPGDLVVFSGHVTMYIGKGHVVAAPHTGTDVQIEPLFTSIPGDPFLGFYRPSVR